MKKGIEFADETWNPVWGCKNNCPYCFARPIAKRFGRQIAKKEADCRFKLGMFDHGLEYGPMKDRYGFITDLVRFNPAFLYSQLNKKFKKKSTHIFVNSMSDIMYWKSEWWKMILDIICMNTDNMFILFTKDLEINSTELYNEMYGFEQNIVLMFTVNNVEQYEALRDDLIPKHVRWGICFEPLQGEIDYQNVKYFDRTLDWVVIGSETGNRKDKIQVQPEWIEPFYDLKIPVFMKESIKHLVPKDKFRQERI